MVFSKIHDNQKFLQLFNLIIMKIILLAALLMEPILGQTQSISVSGNMVSVGKADTVSLLLWDHFFSESKRMLTQHRVLEQETKSGRFYFRIDSIISPVYFSLYSKSNHSGKPRESQRLYFAEPTDSIVISYVKEGSPVFSGKGSLKFEYQYQLDTFTKKVNDLFLTNHDKYAELKKMNCLNYEKIIFYEVDSLLSVQLALLQQYKRAISKKAAQLFEAELIGKSTQRKYECYSSLLRKIRSKSMESVGQCDTAVLYHVLIQSLDRWKFDSLPDSVLALSREFVKSRIQMLMAAEKKDTYFKTASDIIRNHKGILKDKLLATFMIENFNFIPFADSLLTIAVQQIQTPFCKTPLLSMQNRLSKGSLAYNFVLEDNNGKYRRLSDFLGKTVFLDFWFTGCTGCVQLYKNALAEIENEYVADTSIVFISVSVDTDKTTWLESIQSGMYTSKHAVNLCTGKIGKDHPVINQYGVSFFPNTFLIDSAGRIVRNSSSLREKTEIRELLKETIQ